MVPGYSYTAALAPAVQDPGDPILIADGGAAAIATTAESIVAGDSGLTFSPKWNRNAGRLDLLGRYGGGAAGAVRWGLELDDGGGLLVSISAGQAGLDSGAEVPADTTLALTDNVVNRIWLSRAGVLNKVTSASGTPLAPPDLLTAWSYLGAVTTSAGAVTAIDYSGRLSVGQGSQVWRRTADAGAPTDTPPATVRLLTRTQGGLYLWDGQAYFLLAGVSGGAGSAVRLVKTVTGIADATATALLTVTVPNAAHAAVVRLTILASLGAGGALGAYEASATLEGSVVIARRAGLATVPTAATAVLAASSAVAGAATITLAYDVSGLTGANSATQTFTIRATVTRGGGSSANHQAVVMAEIVNAAASGVTVV